MIEKRTHEMIPVCIACRSRIIVHPQSGKRACSSPVCVYARGFPESMFRMIGEHSDASIDRMIDKIRKA